MKVKILSSKNSSYYGISRDSRTLLRSSKLDNDTVEGYHVLHAHTLNTQTIDALYLFIQALHSK